MPGPDIGEYFVGAYLKIVKKCDFVDYNVRPPEGKLEGLNEFDVLGMNFKDHEIYLCEVTTHIDGLVYKDYDATIERLEKKFKHMKEYAKNYLGHFQGMEYHYMFWSPVVPIGKLSRGLEKLEKKGLEVVMNLEYAECLDELKKEARMSSRTTGNPFFRMLQIVEHVEKKKPYWNKVYKRS